MSFTECSPGEHMNHFAIGDRVEVVDGCGVSWKFGKARPGWRGVVDGPAENNPAELTHWSPAHIVIFENGHREYVAIPLLRKLDDRDDYETLDTAEPIKIVRWSDCPWRPAGVRA